MSSMSWKVPVATRSSSPVSAWVKSEARLRHTNDQLELTIAR
jgi:hypothetical protein